jgi:hypothetical protein
MGYLEYLEAIEMNFWVFAMASVWVLIHPRLP